MDMNLKQSFSDSEVKDNYMILRMKENVQVCQVLLPYPAACEPLLHHLSYKRTSEASNPEKHQQQYEICIQNDLLRSVKFYLIALQLCKFYNVNYSSYLFVLTVNLVVSEEYERLPQEVAAAALEHPEGQVLLELHRALLRIQVP